MFRKIEGNMLRYSFLPSDYHPMALFLGEAADFEMLAEFLKNFASSSKEIPLHESGFCAKSDTSIIITHDGSMTGLVPVSLRDKTFRWVLSPEDASDFSEIIQTLAEPSRRSGSEVLQCGRIGEIPVKASRGEFTDDFLVVEPPAVMPVDR
jgi:hypothetical protein